jgi:hypothetical protein
MLFNSKVKCVPKKSFQHLNKDSISGFRLPGDGEVKNSQHQESRNAEMRKPKSKRCITQMLNTGISVTGRWSDKDSSSSGVPKCEMRNPKISEAGTSYSDFRYREMEKSEISTSKFAEKKNVEIPQAHHTRISDTGKWRSHRLSSSRSPEVPKCEIPKTRNRSITHVDTGISGYREMEKSETLNIRSPEVPKRETPKFQKQAHHTGISDTGKWRSHRLSSS